MEGGGEMEERTEIEGKIHRGNSTVDDRNPEGINELANSSVGKSLEGC